MRYFFHIREGELLVDDEGVEFATIAEARAEAVKLAGALIRDMGARFWDEREWELMVTDRDRLTLFTLYFSGTIAPVSR